MKKWFILLSVFLFTIISYTGCSSSVGTQITFKNLAEYAVYVNFRANTITVPAGQTVVVNDIPKGTFGYSTAYDFPAEATNLTADGDVAGTFTITQAGIKILVLYSSTFIDGTYSLFATLSTTQDLTTPTGP